MSTLQGSDICWTYRFINDNTGLLRPISDISEIYAKCFNPTDESILCELSYPASTGKETITQIGTENAEFNAKIPYQKTEDADLTAYVIETRVVINGKVFKDSKILTEFTKSRTND